MLCHRCGHALNEIARFCDECGTPVASPPVASPPVASPPVASPSSALQGTPPPVPVIPAGKRSRLPLFVFGTGCLVLAGAGALSALVGAVLLVQSGRGPALPFGGGSSSGLMREGKAGAARAITRAPASGAAALTLSPDQRLVKESFGRPHGFRVVFGTDPASGKALRVETWLYPKNAASFIFRDGKYADSTDIPRFRSVLRATNARPEQFVPALTLADFTQQHGDPVFQIDLPTPEGGITAFHFQNGVVGGFEKQSGKLAFVEQLSTRSK